MALPARTAARLFLIGALLASGAAVAAPAAANGAGRRAPAAGQALPVEESLSERRAVRGAPVDEASAAPESAELRELRRFEEQAFPRGGGVVPASVQDQERKDSQAPLPGHWGGSGDLPPELRTEALPARPHAGASSP